MPAGRARVHLWRDERSADIVVNKPWGTIGPTGRLGAWAMKPGLHANTHFAGMIRRFLNDRRRQPDAAVILKGKRG